MSKITSEVVSISPEMAVEWLDQRGPNRKMRRSVAERYARDMSAGCWKLTHQGICFDDHGQLLDGQHRLLAITMADTSVMMMVTRGVPASSQLDMDQLAKRTVADALQLIGMDVNKDDIAICNAMKGGLTAGGKTMTAEQMREFVLAHSGALAFARDLQSTKKKGITSASVAAAIARAWYTEDHGRLQSFIDILKDGIPGEPVADDSAALVLRQTLILHSSISATRSASTGSTRRAMYGRACRAIQAFCAREYVKLIKTPTREIYRLPGEADA